MNILVTQFFLASNSHTSSVLFPYRERHARNKQRSNIVVYILLLRSLQRIHRCPRPCITFCNLTVSFLTLGDLYFPLNTRWRTTLWRLLIQCTDKVLQHLEAVSSIRIFSISPVAAISDPLSMVCISREWIVKV
jgi:hypothetical protein